MNEKELNELVEQFSGNLQEDVEVYKSILEKYKDSPEYDAIVKKISNAINADIYLLESIVKTSKKKTGTFDGIKKFCQSNKIIFDTVLAIILSFMGIMVSCTANHIENTQNAILMEQNKINMKMAGPTIDLEPVYDDEGKVTRIDIMNNGGSLNEKEVSVFPYINYGVVKGKRSYSKREGVVPIKYQTYGKEKEAYKTVSYHTNNGVLFTIQLTEMVEYINKMINRDEPGYINVFYLGSNKNVQEYESESSMACFVDSISFEYLIKIEYSGGIEEEKKIDYFRVITGIGYGNHLNTGVYAIDLNNNNLSELEGVIKGDKGIFIHGLTLTDQPTEIFSQKIDLIRAYYRERKQVPVNECKVIFLGDAETGKTHSIRRLLNDGKKLRKFDGESTPGIETTVSRIKIKDSEITVNYWDFGGQEIQHSMHRAFLTERTVYVVFLNARQDDLMDERARYWMENIKAFAPNAPVLVVINKIDQNKNPRFNENGILESYSGQVKKVIRISAKKDNRQDFLGKLQGNINSIVMELPTVSKKIPYSWKALMENIREMKDHYLTAEQFIDKCKTNRIKDYKEIHDELVDLFQVIGVSFCYYKNRSIADYMLLNPKWMLNALYTIVTNGKIVSKNGIISQGHLFDLLKEDIIKETPINRVIPDLRYDGTEINFILGVIRMFRLSYHLQDGSEFFPMLCDGNEKKPVTEVPENALHFIFKYDYLPTNVMHRLIVEMQRDIDYENVWYTGAVFRNESQNQTAYIRSLKNDLHIYVYGEEEFFSFNEYLTPIQNIVRYINKSLGISAEEYLTYRLNGAETEILYDEVKGNLRNQLYTRYDARIRGVIDYRVISHRYYYESHNTDAVLQSIINALEKLQNDSTYYRKKNQNSKDLEDSRNRFVSGHLNTAGYLCNDQQTGGISPSGESAGERDFVVRDKSGRDILIYEGLNLNSLRKDYLDLHIKKLIDNYNPLGLRQGVLVTYLECGKDKYLGFTDRYRKHISEFAPGLYRCVGEPRDIPFKGQFMTCMVMNYEIGGVHFEIDHLIVRVAE